VNHDTGGAWWSSCSELKLTRPVIDCANQESSQIELIASTSEFEYTVVRKPPIRAHFGESGSAYSPTFCRSSLSRPASSSGLDSLEPFCSSQTVAKM
jgi:hypothetical protein